MQPDESMISAAAEYVHATAGDRQFVAECTTAAAALVDRFIGTSTVPGDIRRSAILEVTANLFNRRSSSRDASTALDADSTASFFRPALDPLTPAYPMLRPFMKAAFI